MKNIHKQEYFTICVCTGYIEVGYSPLYIYYELLVLVISQYEYDILVITQVQGKAEDEC